MPAATPPPTPPSRQGRQGRHTRPLIRWPRSGRGSFPVVTMPGARALAVASLLLVMAIWGSTFVVTKSALDQVPPLLLALLRFAVASAILLPLAHARGGPALLPRPLPLGRLALMGATGVTLYFVAFNLSLAYTTASEGALIQGSIPAVSALAAVVLLRERLGPGRAAGITASVAGVALVVLAGGGGEAPNRPLGNALMVGSVVAWAIYTVLGRRLGGASGLATTAYSTLLGTLFLVPPAAIELATRPRPTLSADGWLAVAYLGAVASALAFLLWNRALAVLDVGQASAFINLVPLVGVATATLVLGEPLLPAQLAGGGLVLVGVALCSR